MAEPFDIACREWMSLDFRFGSTTEVSRGHGNVRSWGKSRRILHESGHWVQTPTFPVTRDIGGGCFAVDLRHATARSRLQGRYLPDSHFDARKAAEIQGFFWAALAHGGYCSVTDMSPSQQRRAIRRRKAAVTGALRYLNEGLARLPGVRKGTAEKRVRDSSQPMTTAKAFVKEWHGRKRAFAATPPADDRAALIRAAYAMELGHGWPAGDRAMAA